MGITRETTDNTAFAEECRKALEKSYGFEIPLPKAIRKKALARNSSR
jgi:hypothetical protein